MSSRKFYSPISIGGWFQDHGGGSCLGMSEHVNNMKWPGPRLNIKTVLSTYGDFHVKDKTAVRTSYL